jgi:hypothetical protein
MNMEQWHGIAISRENRKPLLELALRRPRRKTGDFIQTSKNERTKAGGNWFRTVSSSGF